MSKDDDKKPGKIDFSKFRVSLNSREQPIAEKVIVHVPVRKPSKQMFVRVHPDKKYNQPAALLKLEDEEKPYLISESLRSKLAQDVKIIILHLSIDRQGNIFLWPVPPIPIEGNENTWNQSQRQIAEMAKKQWLRLSSNRVIGCYEPHPAKGVIPEPIWPNLSLDEVLHIAFGSMYIIDSLDHPALRKLRGAD
jgi:hypothetical protein